MKPGLRRWLRELTPPAIAAISTRRHLVRFDDRYSDWSSAARAAVGYDSPEILKRAVAAAREVDAGRAAFDRDGIAFPDPQYRWPVLASLLWQSERTAGDLRVLDLGGATGSLYRQHRRMLAQHCSCWGVVEQPLVASASREFADGHLLFFDSVKECIAATSPNTLVLSSVLQYLPDIDAALQDCLVPEVTMVIIDRTPVVAGPSDRFAVQHVPSSIYQTSYPARLVSREGLLRRFEGWEPVAEFESIEPRMWSAAGVEIDWIGMTLVRKQS